MFRRVCCLLLLLIYDVNGSKCKHVGQRFVDNFIQFQCAEGDAANELQIKPIGCVPSNSGNGSAIPLGLSYTGKHFRYECVKDDLRDHVQLKITHCVDNKGSIIAIGEHFTITNDVGEHETMECVGDAQKVKKVVFKWKKCKLPGGSELTEGNFITKKVAPESLRTELQTEEIISCQRRGADVDLQCTGCVALDGIHVGVASYSNIRSQWVQCRRVLDGCRLVNVTEDYINCQYNDQTYQNGETFESRSGKTRYVCDHGAVLKLGCLFDNTLVALGNVHYVDGEPQLCRQVDEPMKFDVRGCQTSPTFTRKFMETWKDGDVMKRCGYTIEGNYVKPEITEYACYHIKEEVALNTVVQSHQGVFKKCIKTDSGGLIMQEMDSKDTEAYLKRKSLHLNLVEYLGVGGKGIVQSDVQHDDSCRDHLPYCRRLVNYCSDGEADAGLMIEAYEEYGKVQKLFEDLSGAKKGPLKPIGCETQLAPFRKVQVMVEMACQRTCKRCIPEHQLDSLVDNLENTSHCGK
ncbi:unnamed protein product [Bursaphelenchus okinawaensis]|uniref:Abnormal cell migration protein 18-like fibronectin type I domain-containing protein n=1 Tax=Bursaphelenchus okinawaensis TaxID=465554 RepID=A0A811LKS7_9BILA|nr:unnamed protein product [Bursaphelenchus okinawaensis]CAG9124279.1 unnamed protein product [Bursaphelenchus okinawaensis]